MFKKHIDAKSRRNFKVAVKVLKMQVLRAKGKEIKNAFNMLI